MACQQFHGDAGRPGLPPGGDFRLSRVPLSESRPMKTMARPRDKAEILRRMKALRPECSRRWGRMSAHQMVCHLCDSFRLVTRQKDASASTGLLQSTVIKWIALYVPLPWPAGVPTRPEMD